MEINKEEKREEKKEEKTKDKNENTKGKKSSARQNRVVINKAANEELERVLLRAGEGDDSVEITKSDLANYVFANLHRLVTDADIRALRQIHFNERKILQVLLKQSNEGAELPPEVKRVIREYCGFTSKEKKRANKLAQDTALETEKQIA